MPQTTLDFIAFGDKIVSIQFQGALMKNLKYFLILSAIILALASCGSMPSPTVSGVLGAVAGGAASGSASSGGAIAAPAAAVEFQSGEVLASADAGKMSDAAYYVSKVLAPASPDTKNQAQVIMIEDGKKYWVNYILNSRKAAKSDFVVGATVFVLSGWGGHDEISADTYRKARWALGNVTSIEELFKGHVEVDGIQFAVNYVRVPTDPIK
jgi:hypothetical protein